MAETLLEKTFRDAGWSWNTEVGAWDHIDGDFVVYVLPVGFRIQKDYEAPSDLLRNAFRHVRDDG